MAILVSEKTAVWVRTALTIGSVLLFVIGLAGVPDDLKTWTAWASLLQGNVPWWVLIVAALVLIALTWVPRVRLITTENKPPISPDRDIASSESAAPAVRDETAIREQEQLRASVVALQQQVAAFTSLPDRIVGLLGAGRSLTLSELRQQLQIADHDSDRRAGLEACLGVLIKGGIVAESTSRLEAYRLVETF